MSWHILTHPDTFWCALNRKKVAKVVPNWLKSSPYTSKLTKSGSKWAKMGQKLLKMSQNRVIVLSDMFWCILTCFDAFWRVSTHFDTIWRVSTCFDRSSQIPISLLHFVYILGISSMNLILGCSDIRTIPKKPSKEQFVTCLTRIALLTIYMHQGLQTASHFFQKEPFYLLEIFFELIIMVKVHKIAKMCQILAYFSFYYCKSLSNTFLS